MLLFLFVSLNCKKDTGSYSNPTSGFYNLSGNPSTSAWNYLNSANYKSLKIELQYMPGFKPDSRAIHIFTDLLNERLNKPSGIFIEEKEIDPTLMERFTLNDISGIESRNRTVFNHGDQMSAYILFVSGSYYDGNVLGIAYKNTSICFFGEPIRYFIAGGTEQDRIKLMAILLTHEFGHLLGLVNMGTSMVVNHIIAVDDNHCDNNKCLMHHTYEANTQNLILNFEENPSFDINCINDLKANGGK
jgi:hypothetical protein